MAQTQMVLREYALAMLARAQRELAESGQTAAQQNYEYDRGKLEKALTDVLEITEGVEYQCIGFPGSAIAIVPDISPYLAFYVMTDDEIAQDYLRCRPLYTEPDGAEYDAWWDNPANKLAATTWYIYSWQDVGQALVELGDAGPIELQPWNERPTATPDRYAWLTVYQMNKSDRPFAVLHSVAKPELNPHSGEPSGELLTLVRYTDIDDPQ